MIQFLKYALLAAMLISGPSAHNVYALCRTCSESYGVVIKLKTGESLKGYIAWYPEILPVSTLIQKINLYASSDEPLPHDIAIWKSLTLYSRFEPITYPVKTYVGIEEGTQTIPFQDIKQIELKKNLTLKINTTRINVVPKQDIRHLNEPPVYIFSENKKKPGWPTEYYIAISSTAHPIDILFYHYRGIKSIIFLGEILAGYDYQNAEISCIRSDKEAKDICSKVIADWEQLAKDSVEMKNCYSERNNALELLRQTTYFLSAAQSPRMREKDEECSEIELKLRKKHPFHFPFQTPLRKIGFINITLGTDYTLVQ